MHGRVFISVFILCVTVRHYLPSAMECTGKPRLSEKICSFNTTDCHGSKGYIFCDGKCIDLDECSQHKNDPCGHRGTCINHVGGYSCKCLEGWNGTDYHCSNNVTDHPNCMPGYHGDRCQTAKCGDHGYPEAVGIEEIHKCICEEGWKSVNGPCNQDIDECVETPGICQHGASCVNLNGSYTCLCINGWYGCNCTQYNCTAGGCVNGGTCINGSCSCPPMRAGEDCSLPGNVSWSTETSFYGLLSTPQLVRETEEQDNTSSTQFLVSQENQYSLPIVMTHQNQSSTPSVSAHQNQSSTPSVSAHQNQNSTPSVSAHQNQSFTPSVSALQNQSSTQSVSAHKNQNSTTSVSAQENQSSTTSVSAHQNQSSTPSVSAHQTQSSTPSVSARQNQRSTPSVSAHQNQSSTQSVSAHKNQSSTPSISAHKNQSSTPLVQGHDKHILTPIVVSTLSGILLVGLVMAVYYRIQIKKRTEPSFA